MSTYNYRNSRQQNIVDALASYIALKDKSPANGGKNSDSKVQTSAAFIERKSQVKSVPRK